MIVVIVVCLALAGVIVYKSTRRDTGIEAYAGKMTWMMCNNPKCGYTYQMDLKKYFEYVEAHVDPGSMQTPALPCPKCGEKSVYRAVKCPKCGKIFFMGSVANSYRDTCPECGYSQIEVDRKKAAERRRKQ